MILLLTFQRVQDDYSSGGWTKHHTQRLEYEATNTKNPNPAIVFEVAEPANDWQKDWHVTLITADCVSYTCNLLFLFELFDFQLSSLLHGFVSLYGIQFEKAVVDRLTKKDTIPVTSFGIQWMGSSDTAHYNAVRKIKLLGMKGPYNYFTIFLPKDTLEAEKNKEGMHTLCTHTYKLI